MEMVVEKIEVIGSHKNNLIDIFSVGQKIHEAVNTCGDNCDCYKNYLTKVNNLIENIAGQEISAEEKLIFHELSLKTPHSFILFDQINKTFGAEIYQMTTRCFKLDLFFEIEKYLKTVGDIEKLEGNLYVFSKTFLQFFLEENP